MKLKLIEKKSEAAGVESFVFEPSGTLVWHAGQYLHYVLHHEPTDDRGSDRWFTVASAPSEKHVMITTRIASEHGSSFKKALASIKLGGHIEISEVEGDFVIDNPASEYVFIAGGIGVTPFRAILKEADLAGTPLRATLLYSNRDSDIPYRQELDEMAGRNPNLNIHYFVGERIDEAAIRARVPNIEKPLFFVSGPEPMVEAFGPMLHAMGIAPARIKQDWFPGYPAE